MTNSGADKVAHADFFTKFMCIVFTAYVYSLSFTLLLCHLGLYVGYGFCAFDLSQVEF